MVSNKVKRNIWLVLSIISFLCVIARAITVIEGTSEWWKLVTYTVIFAVSFKLYLNYRKQVQAGNLFGKVDHFRHNS